MLLEILIFLGLVFVIDALGRKYCTRKLINIPIVSKLPIFGTILILSSITPDNCHITWRQILNRFGRTLCARILGTLVIVTIDQKIVDAILSSQIHLEKHKLYDIIRVWLGNGLVLNSGKSWHTMRKILTPAFHFNILEKFVEVFDRQTNVMIEKLKMVADGAKVVNIYDYMSLLTMDIITETAMGVTISAQLHTDSEYVKAVRQISDIMAKRFFRPHLAFETSLRIFAPKMYHNQQKSLEILHQFTDKIIAERQKTLGKREATSFDPNNNDAIDLGSKKRMALLDVLLHSSIEGEPLSDKQIRDEVTTFMFEGHDTTASAASFCLYALSRHLDVQKKVFDELREYFGDQTDRAITYNDLQHLNYLSCVIKESLRLYPPILAIGRVLKTDLKVDKYLLPAKSNIIILLLEMLRDPTVFDQPLSFIPERHLMNDERVNTFRNIPFSAGPRNCIGQKFAQMELRLIVAKVIRNFELLPLGEDVQLRMQLILCSKTGINFGLRPRTYQEQ